MSALLSSFPARGCFGAASARVRWVPSGARAGLATVFIGASNSLIWPSVRVSVALVDRRMAEPSAGGPSHAHDSCDGFDGSAGGDSRVGRRRGRAHVHVLDGRTAG